MKFAQSGLAARDIRETSTLDMGLSGRVIKNSGRLSELASMEVAGAVMGRVRLTASLNDLPPRRVKRRSSRAPSRQLWLAASTGSPMQAASYRRPKAGRLVRGFVAIRPSR